MRTTTRRVVSSLFALMLFSTAGLSQVLKPPRVARSVATAPLVVDEQSFRTAPEPIELSLREDLRERCREFALPPEPYVIESPAGSEVDALALEGLVACLAQSPLAGRDLDLIGPTELPGRYEQAVESPAAADVARALLGRLGVPTDRMVTYDVPLDPLVSPHLAPRVVLAPSEG